MPRLVFVAPSQSQLENEFASLLATVKQYLKDMDETYSNEFVGLIMGRSRNWIERRLLPPSRALKISVELTDVLALRYVADCLISGRERFINLRPAGSKDPVATPDEFHQTLELPLSD